MTQEAPSILSLLPSPPPHPHTRVHAGNKPSIGRHHHHHLQCSTRGGGGLASCPHLQAADGARLVMRYVLAVLDQLLGASSLQVQVQYMRGWCREEFRSEVGEGGRQTAGAAV